MRGSVTGTTVTLAAGALLTAVMTTASASPPTAAARTDAPRPALVDCTWRTNVRPTDFILACGDGNSRLMGLHWKQWSPDAATATGVNVVNDCKPYCAAGHFHGYPVTVRLQDPKPWKKQPGVRHYTLMTLTYAQDRPDGFQQVMTYPLWD